MASTRRRIAVIGLGRMGGSLARDLQRRGAEVLGLDADPSVVQAWADELTHAVIADATDREALDQLRIAGYDSVVVSIGEGLEASVLATSLVADLGVPDIWAKATSDRHARILERMGAHHVVRPERDAARRLSVLLAGGLGDVVSLGEDYSVAVCTASRTLHGPLDDLLRLPNGPRVRVIARRSGTGAFVDTTPGTRIDPGDVVVVAGAVAAVDELSR
ncbi:potassium channel family protein [Oryzobacter sp. R7]|uniref:potassium channel family protein n=1 Tax=Oryzobacter faecalis TaxID=3388656 RepID=UPI00398D076E